MTGGRKVGRVGGRPDANAKRRQSGGGRKVGRVGGNAPPDDKDRRRWRADVERRSK